MATRPFVWVVVVGLMSMVVPNTAKVYTIGETEGWTMGVDYPSWTSGKTFAVGDSLVFNYGGGHTVDEVSESDYKTCTAGNSMTTDSSGSTTIALKTAGTQYFICGAVGHCGSGMKLAVKVASPGSSSSTTTTTTTTPSDGANNPNVITNTPSVTTVPTSKVPVEFSSGYCLKPGLLVLLFGLCGFGFILSLVKEVGPVF